MKNIILTIAISLSTYSFGQIGINTTNPQQILHIDGLNDNPNSGAPTSIQQSNDVVINNKGYIGVGTSEPTKRVDIMKSSPGAIKIVDGTQGDEKIFLSNSNGVGRWTTPQSFKDVVLGQFYRSATGGEITTTSDNTGGVKYLNANIKLTKGKWIVNAGSTLKTRVSAEYIVWIHMYLSSTTNSVTQTGWKHLGTAGNNVSYAGLLHGYKDTFVDGLDNDNFVFGSSLIEVTDNETVINLLIENLANINPGNLQNTGLKFYTTSGYWENYFYAIPVN